MMIFLLIGAGILYLLWKYGLKPYLHMQHYFKKYEGATLIPFVPINGEFQFINQAFRKYGDQNYEYKRMLKNRPGTKFLVLNALNFCFLGLTDVELLQQYFQKQDHYVKQISLIQNKARLVGSALTVLEGKQWSKRKEIVVPLYHSQFFNSFQTYMQSIVDKQIATIEKSQKGQFQLKSMFDLIVGEILIKTFFGKSIDQAIQDKKTSVWLNQLFDDSIAQTKTLRNLLFGIHILKLGLFVEDRKVNQRIKLFRSIARNAIQTKLDSSEIKGSILEIIKQKGLLEKEGGLTASDFIDQFLGNYSEGREQISYFLTMAFYYLVMHDTWQTKLRKEMKKFKIWNNFEHNKISELKHLQYFIKQTFRHYGYIGSIFPRRCIKGHKIGSIQVRQGDFVVPAWNNLNYHPELFPKPLEFDPMRWQNAAKLHSYAFTPFSAGPRRCPAQNFVEFQIKLVLIKFLSAFQIKLKAGYKHELKTANLYGPVNPIQVKIARLKSQ